MVFLGIDYGDKNIGLAISEGSIARPLAILKNNQDKIYLNLEKICQENRVDKIVIGLPDGRMKIKIKRFAKKLEKFVKKPVVLHDETLSTKEAYIKMKEAGKKLEFVKKKDHLFAAGIILQSYLEQKS